MQPLIANALASWNQEVGRLDKIFAALSDADLEQSVAPGRNRAFYLLGHLTAVHDRMIALLRVGDRLHPELDQEFLTDADTHAPSAVSAGTLRAAWAEVNGTLTKAIEALTPEQWLERHNSITPDDFAREPLRNRFSVLLARTTHAASHLGQLRLIRK